MSKYPMGKVKMYEISVNNKVVGYAAKENKWDAILQVVRSFGFVSLCDYIDRYPGKFNPKSKFSEIANYNEDPKFYKLDRLDIAYDHYFRTVVLYDKYHITNYSEEVAWGIIHSRYTTIVYPTVQEVKKTVPFRHTPNSGLWFCLDWKED